jgi:hypothetical protein
MFDSVLDDDGNPELILLEVKESTKVVSCLQLNDRQDSTKNTRVWMKDHVYHALAPTKLIGMHAICFFAQLNGLYSAQFMKKSYLHNLITMATVPLYQLMILLSYSEVCKVEELAS